MSVKSTIMDDPEGGRTRFEEAGTISMPLLTVAHAAKYMGVARKDLYRLIEWGEIRAVTVGGSLQVEKASLDEYRASGKLI